METIELIKRSRAGDKLAREQVIKGEYAVGIQYREAICRKRI